MLVGYFCRFGFPIRSISNNLDFYDIVAKIIPQKNFTLLQIFYKIMIY